jgi:hypothetical protein
MEPFQNEEIQFLIYRPNFNECDVAKPGYYPVCYNRIPRAKYDQMRRAQTIVTLLFN